MSALLNAEPPWYRRESLITAVAASVILFLSLANKFWIVEGSLVSTLLLTLAVSCCGLIMSNLSHGFSKIFGVLQPG
jgi:hypothetical protein